MNGYSTWQRRYSRPWVQEQGRRKWRGVIDLLSGCYPAFLFGGAVGNILPVFHFHEVAPEALESRLCYLADNGYRTVTSEAISRFVQHGTYPGARAVALCFDDAWASLWTVAAPLLRRYGFSAITYAIPGRIAEARAVRPTMEDEGLIDPTAVDRSQTPFVTWPELQALHTSGIIDVQCHSYSHAMVFCADRIVSFVTPTYGEQHLLRRPLLSANGSDTYMQPADLGSPIYPQCTRLCDRPRFFNDETVRCRCVEYVQAKGGMTFFLRPSWEAELLAVVQAETGVYESAEQQKQAIYDDLDRGRRVLNERLKTNTVRHLCFPWGIAGTVARQAAQDLGYDTAFSDRPFGLRAIRADDPPYRLMRLRNDFIFRLPGRGRRLFSLGM